MLKLPQRYFDLATDLAMSAANFAGRQILPRIERGHKARGAVTQLSNSLLIAHRGAWIEKGFRENTLASLIRAIEVGADGIEFDIRKLRDGTFVVHHDTDLLRTHGRPLKLDALTLQTLEYEAPDVPTLKSFLATGKKTLADRSKPFLFFAEIKGPSGEWSDEDLRAVIELLNEIRSAQIEYYLMSLDFDLLIRIVERGILASDRLVSIATLFPMKRVLDSVENQLGGATAHWSVVQSETLRVLRWAKLKVGIGFADSKEVLEREIRREMDWIFTNRIHEAVHWRTAITGEVQSTAQDSSK